MGVSVSVREEIYFSQCGRSRLTLFFIFAPERSNDCIRQVLGKKGSPFGRETVSRYSPHSRRFSVPSLHASTRVCQMSVASIQHIQAETLPATAAIS